jgi:hypothetical protein
MMACHVSTNRQPTVCSGGSVAALEKYNIPLKAKLIKIQTPTYRAIRPNADCRIENFSTKNNQTVEL